MVDISQNITNIRQQIFLAAKRVNRDPEDIILLAATKDVGVDLIEKAINFGISYIGENKIQEAKPKIEKLKEKYPHVKWHFIGHLQTNKVKTAIEMFDVIESVDSKKLIEEISRRAQERNKSVEIFIEVNTSREKSKFGVFPEDLEDLIRFASNFKNIKVKGLMTIPSPSKNPEDSRPYFRMLNSLREEMNSLNIPGVKIDYLSMGMTDDFVVAVEEGADIVRIGRGIFGIEHKH